ncbi:MAG: TIGR02680 family protein, partial [Actinomycetota bacterium]
GLGRDVHAAVAPVLGGLREEEARATERRRQAEADLLALRSRREAIAAEHDPAPPEPVLGRSDRSDSDGAPLWRLVDFADDLDAAERAGLEAALESSGLLDAWVRTDGAVLDADRRDVVLPAGEPAAGGRTLADVLVADPPEGSAVAADVVRTVLARVGADPGAGAAAVVGLDGTWRLGPLTGRAAKPVAQYVGATARAAERARRLAEVDALVAQATLERDEARASAERARGRRVEVEAWLTELPDVQPLLTAWTRHEERQEAAARAEAAADAAEQAAVGARQQAASRRRELAALADRHRLPVTAAGLAERREALRALQVRVRQASDAVPALRRRLERWGADWSLWQGDVADAERLEAEAREAQAVAHAAAEQHRTLSETVGADVEELQRRLVAVRGEIEEARRELNRLREVAGRLREELGAARTALDTARERRHEQEPAVVAAARSLAALADVPGLLTAAGVDAGEEGESLDVAIGMARGLEAGASVPRRVSDLARRLAGLEPPERGCDAAALFAALQQATSSDAADHEPRVVGAGDLLAALGRDDGGEHPVVELAERLAASVRHDQQLLTERERALFEEHLIGELGEVLRRRRLEAADLVEGMNGLLSGVTTSQGIAVRLQWQLRDDVPEDARRAVTLLGREVGALLPTERAELRDALHRLIEASRAEAPEDGYAEHLSRALDYRRWFAFRIRYTRPEAPGKWQDLHRRSPLSQGEQKVVCYLPLFAAAAAHFTSLAGAAPHAPRFILLDDAFPKIDVRTHPLLFGLLVDLDLDFVITSERLWGDHATVPSLAIYEALRDPGERGIAQFRYTWDGARLQAVGA